PSAPRQQGASHDAAYRTDLGWGGDRVRRGRLRGVPVVVGAVAVWPRGRECRRDGPSHRHEVRGVPGLDIRGVATVAGAVSRWPRARRLLPHGLGSEPAEAALVRAVRRRLLFLCRRRWPPVHAGLREWLRTRPLPR